MGTGDEFYRIHGTTARSFSVGSRARAAACAALDVVSTSKGILFPRMSSTQRLAVSSPAEGLVVFDTTNKTLYVYAMSTWLPLDAGTGTFFPIDTTDVLTGFSAYIAADGKAYETDARYVEQANFAGVDVGLPDLLQAFGPAEARFTSVSPTPVPGQVVYLARGDDEASDQSRGKLTTDPPPVAHMVHPVGLVLSVPGNYATEQKATVLFQPCTCGGVASGSSFAFDASCTADEEVGHLVIVTGDGPVVSKMDIESDPPTHAVGIIVSKSTDTSCVVQTAGRVSISGLTPGSNCFVGEDSKPTSTGPGRSATKKRTIQKVGQAITSTSMELRMDGQFVRVLPT